MLCNECGKERNTGNIPHSKLDNCCQKTYDLRREIFGRIQITSNKILIKSGAKKLLQEDSHLSSLLEQLEIAREEVQYLEAEIRRMNPYNDIPF